MLIFIFIFLAVLAGYYFLGTPLLSYIHKFTEQFTHSFPLCAFFLPVPIPAMRAKDAGARRRPRTSPGFLEEPLGSDSESVGRIRRAGGGSDTMSMGTRLRISGLLGVLLIGTAPLVLDRAGAQEFPLRSVFQVLIMNKTNGHAVASGTGFFVGADGTALTSSHIVYPVKTKRGAYEALAVVNQEFYGVEIICASDLAYDPTKLDTHTASRDVAEIKLIPPRPSLDAITSANIPFARAHVGPFPKFPALALGDDPAVGDSVRILGFGNLASPLPYEWSAMGRVSGTGVAVDGTPLFNVIFTRNTEPGHSGSPVLNTRDQVVGIHSWHLAHDPTMGLEISSSALRPPCP